MALEPLALQQAAQNMSPTDLDRIEAARIACDDAETMPEWEARNRAFHRHPDALRFAAPVAHHR